MKIKPVYLLLGPENGEKGQFIKECKQELKNLSNNSFEEHRFYPFETDMLKIMDILHNGSLFTDYKIVTLYQVETITKKDDIELLLSYVKQPTDNTVLLLISDEIQIDKRLRKGFPKDFTKIFWEMFENKKQDWVSNFFTRNGKTIHQEAAELILELVDNNTLDLQRECHRLLQHYQDKELIVSEDVESFLYHSKEENVFTLFDKIAKKDLEGSLDVAEKLALSGDADSVQLFGGLLWQFKRLQSIAYYVRNHFSLEEACKKCGLTSKKAQNAYKGALQNYSYSVIENIIQLISEYDYKIRESKSEMETLLFSLFLYCCIRKNGVLIG